MNMKIGLAAAVFAAVGTFAVAEGAGEGGCGDGSCVVGTSLSGNAPFTMELPSGQTVQVDAGHKESGRRAEFSGLNINSPGYGSIGRFYNPHSGAVRTGNCLDMVGNNGDNGCNNWP